MTKTNLIRKYRDKYPDYPNLKLARVIYKDHNLEFSSVESIRSTLRAIEGKSSKSTKPTHKREPRPYNPYKLPESDETDYAPYVIRGKSIGILSDIHAPYHSIDALSAALEWMSKVGVDTVVLNGDLFDFHGLSRYVKDPKKRSFADELDCGAEIIKTIQRELKAKVIFKLGNHDERYEHFLWTKASELSGVEDFKLDKLIANRVGGVTVVGEKRIMKAGSLNIIHGHELPSGMISPVNIARGFYLRSKTSVIGGHHHRSSEHTEQDMNGKIITSFSVGCLSELHPQYMPINSWNHGAAIIKVEGKEFEVTNRRIYNGKIL